MIVFKEITSLLDLLRSAIIGKDEVLLTKNWPWLVIAC